MNTIRSNYYVYVYIDPRNFEEFYYGKGTGDRKLAHLQDNSDSEKALRIRAIKAVGLEPIIKVIAKDLTENEAFLVEKTLIWRLGKNLTNKSSGRFASKFRPHNTFHENLHEFDFGNCVYFVNVGEREGKTRNWDDCRKYGFMAAGQNWKKWGSKLYVLNRGDIVAAYLKDFGFVGIGRVTGTAQPVTSFRFNGRPLSAFPLVQPNICTSNVGNGNECDHLITIEWIKSVPREKAKWVKKSGLFSKQHIVASLEGQPKTLKFLEQEFGISLERLLLSPGKARLAG